MPHPRKKDMAMFLKNKYATWYYNIINKAKCQQRKKLKRNNPIFVYYESHHIIPLCMNGTEKVLLTAKEHFICHLLLCKMTVGKIRHMMINALIKMSFCKSKGQERYTAKSYDLVKKYIAQKNSEMFSNRKVTWGHKISKARIGMKFSDEHRKNIGVFAKTRIGQLNGFYGKKHSKTQKQLWSIKRKGIVTDNKCKGKTWIVSKETGKRIWI